MSKKTKTELAIDYIAKHVTARSPDISKASGIPANRVCSMLYPYVKAGVLISCRVEQPGKSSCNEYRLGGHVPADAWRDFKVNVHSLVDKPKNKQVLPPAHTPADRPEVSETNTGSTSAENSSLAATGRAVTEAKPHRKASQHAPGVGGHVTAKAARNIPENIPDSVITKFGYFSDGSVRIVSNERAIELDAADAGRLAEFLINCMTTTGLEE